MADPDRVYRIPAQKAQKNNLGPFAIIFPQKKAVYGKALPSFDV
jgi:hypothetical protein